MPRTVRSGLRAPSLARSWAMWTSTVRVPADSAEPQTAARSCSRVKTRPGRPIRNASRSNSVAVRDFGVPAAVTVRAPVSRTTSPARRAPSGEGSGSWPRIARATMETRTRGLKGRGTAYGPGLGAAHRRGAQGARAAGAEGRGPRVGAGAGLAVRDDAHDRRGARRVRDVLAGADRKVEDDDVRGQPPHRRGGVLGVGHEMD